MKCAMRLFNKRKHFDINVLFCLFAIILWLLMAFGRGSADLAYYEEIYTRIQSGIEYYNVEWGYFYLNKLAVVIGLGFTTFYALYAGVGMVLFCAGINRIAKSSTLVLFSYFCYPFLLDSAQIRHFMVCAILIYSIKYLESYSISNLVKYIIAILIAATQHSIAFVFLTLLVIYFKDLKTIKRIAVATTVSFLVLGETLVHTKLFSLITGLRNKEIIYESGTPAGQFIQYILFFGCVLALCWWLNKDKDGLLYRISILSIIFIPIIRIDFQFTRLFRSLLPAIYTLLYNSIKTHTVRDNKKYYTVFAIMVVIVVAYVLFGPSSGYYQLLTVPRFTQSILW